MIFEEGGLNLCTVLFSGGKRATAQKSSNLTRKNQLKAKRDTLIIGLDKL